MLGWLKKKGEDRRKKFARTNDSLTDLIFKSGEDAFASRSKNSARYSEQLPSCKLAAIEPTILAASKGTSVGHIYWSSKIRATVIVF